MFLSRNYKTLYHLSKNTEKISSDFPDLKIGDYIKIVTNLRSKNNKNFLTAKQILSKNICQDSLTGKSPFEQQKQKTKIYGILALTSFLLSITFISFYCLNKFCKIFDNKKMKNDENFIEFQNLFDFDEFENLETKLKNFDDFMKINDFVNLIENNKIWENAKFCYVVAKSPIKIRQKTDSEKSIFTKKDEAIFILLSLTKIPIDKKLLFALNFKRNFDKNGLMEVLERIIRFGWLHNQKLAIFAEKKNIEKIYRLLMDKNLILIDNEKSIYNFNEDKLDQIVNLFLKND
ncbi:hypothetical protein MHBO_000217 [Bonamia ostreae]